jgi:hypothetical protein
MASGVSTAGFSGDAKRLLFFGGSFNNQEERDARAPGFSNIFFLSSYLS